MRCHICDTDADLAYNPRTKTFDPCPDCQEVIDEAVSEFDGEEETIDDET